MTSVNVTIGGRHYRLRCDDQERTLRAAAEVERLLELLRSDSTDQSTPTLAILAALNIAERHDALGEQHNKIVEYLTEQLRRINAYLGETMEKAVKASA
ncbi:MAG: cell division protein ZapA [Chlorobi bacterium]|nr:cell division protein ZapA [Chlorobiota bacterium]